MSLLQKLQGKTRCPACGTIAVHKRNKEAEKKQKELLKWKKEVGLSQTSSSEIVFNCIKCDHEFDHSMADSWEKTAKKIGEDRAIAEHNSIQNYWKE